MNWSKTKSTLIIALVITNIIMLAYIFSERQMQKSPEVYDRMVYSDVLKVLESRNITVAFSAVPPIEGIQAVEAAYQSYDLGNMADRFLPNGYAVSSDGTEATFAGQKLRIIDRRQLIYDNKDVEPSTETMAEEEGLAVARKFMEDHGYSVDETMRLSSVRVVPEGMEVVYGQQIGHRDVENGLMRVVVSGAAVRRFERSWLNVLKVREMNYSIIPPGRALLKLTEQLSSEQGHGTPIIITAMTVGYQLDTNAINTYILSGDLSPYWRFTTRSGVTYSVKALQ